MTDTTEDGVVRENCENLRQGDVVDIAHVPLVQLDGTWGHIETAGGVVVLSQTCDLVQRGKSRCLVAPVIDADNGVLNDARKGRKPLHLFLGDHLTDGVSPRVADMELAVSLPKAQLIGRPIRARYTAHASGVGVSEIGYRVGRAFARFPFPDELYPVFREFRSRTQSKTGTPSAYGRVMDLACDVRVSVRGGDWGQIPRLLKIWVIVPTEWIDAAGDGVEFPGWTAGSISGLRRNEQPDAIEFDRVCDLILANPGKPAVLGELWRIFGTLLVIRMFPDRVCGPAGAEVEVEVLSELDMNYRDFTHSESLDLEALSLAK